MNMAQRVTAVGLGMSLSLGIAAWLAPQTPAAEPAKSVPLAKADEARLTPENFDQLHKQIRPQAGESRWLEIPWFLDLHEARQKAAAEGKPLFVYSGGGATGIGAC